MEVSNQLPIFKGLMIQPTHTGVKQSIQQVPAGHPSSFHPFPKELHGILPKRGGVPQTILAYLILLTFPPPKKSRIYIYICIIICICIPKLTWHPRNNYEEKKRHLPELSLEVPSYTPHLSGGPGPQKENFIKQPTPGVSGAKLLVVVSGRVQLLVFCCTHDIAPKAIILSFLALSTWVHPEAVLAVGRHRLQVPIDANSRRKRGMGKDLGPLFCRQPCLGLELNLMEVSSKLCIINLLSDSLVAKQKIKFHFSNDCFLLDSNLQYVQTKQGVLSDTGLLRRYPQQA